MLRLRKRPNSKLLDDESPRAMKGMVSGVEYQGLKPIGYRAVLRFDTAITVAQDITS